MHDGGLVDPRLIHRGNKFLERHRTLLRPFRSRAANWRHRVAHGVARNDVGMDVDDLRRHAGDLDVWTGSSRPDEQLVYCKLAGNETLLECVKRQRFDAAPVYLEAIRQRVLPDNPHLLEIAPVRPGISRTVVQPLEIALL